MRQTPFVGRAAIGLALLLMATAPGWGMTDLQVSSDGHHLERRSGAPFLLLSDTEWLLNTYPDAGVITILDDRAAKEFTAVQVFATHAYAGSPTLTDSAGNLPFVGNNPTQLNVAYWQRWRAICDLAAARDLHVILVMGEPGRLTDTNVPWRFAANSEAEFDRAYQYARQVGALFAATTNVIFAMGQDSQANGSTMPGWGNCFNAAGWLAMAEGVADGVNGVNHRDGIADFSNTLMTYHGLERYPGGYTDDLSQYFRQEAWCDFYGPEVWHDIGYEYGVVNRDYTNAAPVKPSFVMEGAYEGELYQGTGAPTTPAQVRVQAWHSLFGGLCGYAYGHCQNWQQNGNTAYLSAVGAGQMAHLAAFANQHAWWLWVPDSTLITAGAGSGAARKVGVRSSAGDKAAVYFANATAGTIQNVLAVESSATWFDPRNGNMTGGGLFAAGQARSLTPPSGWEDALLFLTPSASVVATPTAIPNGGTFADAVSVTLTCATSGAEIRYALDGREPTATSTLYAAPFALTSNATLRAKAFKAGLAASYTATADFQRIVNAGTAVVDEFNDGSLAVNTGGIGTGWNVGTFNGAPTPTESDGAFRASMGTENGIGAIHGKDLFTLWDQTGATATWVIRDITVQTPHAYNYYLAYCWELGIISSSASRSGSAWNMSGPNTNGGFYVSIGKKNNSNAVELWVAVSSRYFSGVEGTSGFLRPTQTSTSPGGLGVVFTATFPLTVSVTLTSNGWSVTTSQPGVAPIAGNWTTDLMRPGNNASITDEFKNGAFLFTAGRNHQIDGSGHTYTPNSGALESVSVVRHADSQAALPTLTPAGGLFASAPAVTITTATPGASLYYTLDDSTPTAAGGILYTVPVTVATSATLRAVAHLDGLSDSAVAAGEYVVMGAPHAGVVNGSFEDGTNGWLVASSDAAVAAYTVATNQGFTDGVRALALGSDNRAGNAVFAQLLSTTAGVSYTVNFDYGAFGSAARPQQLRVEARDGSTVVTGRVVSATGTGSFLAGSTTFQPYALTFTATSAATALYFMDETLAANSITCDGMLDDVSITSNGGELPQEPTMTVGQAELVYSNYDPGNTADMSCPTLRKSATEIYTWTENAWSSFKKFSGPLDNPQQTTEWSGYAGRWDLSGFPAGYRPWLANIYKDGDGTLIGFVHIETAEYNDTTNCRFRQGIAISTDEGNHWKYCGDVIKAQNDAYSNLGGCPYVIVGEYFYQYFNEVPLNGPRIPAVARARVADVVAAAKLGTVTAWTKYNNGSWNQDGLTGVGSNITPAPDRYDLHSDATYCAPLGKYLLTAWEQIGYSYVAPFPIDPANRGVYMYSSTDGVNWGDRIKVYTPPANGETPYSFFAGLEGASDDSSTVGSNFFLYFPDRINDKFFRVAITVQGGNTVAAPTFSPAPGTYGAGQWVSITSVTAAASIRYTTDGSDPSGGAGMSYSGPVLIAASGTLKAVATAEGMTASAVTTGAYVIEVVPRVGLVNGSFEEGTTGWTIGSSNLNAPACEVVTNQGWTAGTHALALGRLNQVGNTVLSQLLNTVSGAVYTVQFDHGAFGLGGKPQQVFVEVLDGGTVLASAAMSVNATGSFLPEDTTFQARALEFTALSSNTLLRLSDQTTLNNSFSCDGMLDQVRLTGGNVVGAPTFTPPAGTYVTAPRVAMSTATSGARIRYTLDGSLPTAEHGWLYDGPVTIANPATLRAIAYRDGMVDSGAASASYAFERGGLVFIIR
ncbi:MAG: chitobiase/beta-hexosaminidase C-terminal domain-containing protein [Lentisphaerae bacterium]|nr:chitobiase/beta-hexosaminidase C-terminal domain-containing protein [Lentisphaerota bacterium]